MILAWVILATMWALAVLAMRTWWEIHTEKVDDPDEDHRPRSPWGW